MGSFTPSSCDDGHDLATHVRYTACSMHDKNVPALSNSPIMPGPKLLTQGRETADGRWQDGAAAWICILLFCHFETIPVSLVVPHTIMLTQPYSALPTSYFSSDEFRNFSSYDTDTPLFLTSRGRLIFSRSPLKRRDRFHARVILLKNRVF
jgi:hypothetical protein